MVFACECIHFIATNTGLETAYSKYTREPVPTENNDSRDNALHYIQNKSRTLLHYWVFRGLVDNIFKRVTPVIHFSVCYRIQKLLESFARWSYLLRTSEHSKFRIFTVGCLQTSLIRDDAVQWSGGSPGGRRRGARPGACRGQSLCRPGETGDTQELASKWPPLQLEPSDLHGAASSPVSTPRHVDGSPVHRISPSRTGSVNKRIADNHDNLRDTFMYKWLVLYTINYLFLILFL